MSAGLPAVGPYPALFAGGGDGEGRDPHPFQIKEIPDLPAKRQDGPAQVLAAREGPGVPFPDTLGNGDGPECPAASERAVCQGGDPLRDDHLGLALLQLYLSQKAIFHVQLHGCALLSPLMAIVARERGPVQCAVCIPLCAETAQVRAPVGAPGPGPYVKERIEKYQRLAFSRAMALASAALEW